MPLDIYISSIGFSNIDNVDKLIEKAKKVATKVTLIY